MLKKLSVLLLVLALVSVCPGVPAEEPASPERTVHADLLLTVDYGDQVTYVIRRPPAAAGHQCKGGGCRPRESGNEVCPGSFRH